MKDSHTGAFASICCALYLLLFWATWAETEHSAALVLSLSPALSRCLSALAGVSWRNAKGSGLLATFTAPMDAVRARTVLLTCTVIAAAIMVAADPVNGGAAALAAGLTFLCYRVTAFRQFGGITGDTEGWFLQICELTEVFAIVLVQKVVRA